MVKLSIISSRGNANSRYFPHTGYLGLTPIRVEGVVRTRLEGGSKSLLASSITVSVKCVESRLGRLGATHSNVLVEYPQTLWSKPSDVEWAELGDTEHNFRITVPIKTPGFSCANFQEYRVSWRVEAVIEHTPIFGVGSRQFKHFEIPLVRHDNPVPRQIDTHSRFLTTNKPRAPVIRYHYSIPNAGIGPQDLVSIPLTLHPVNSTVTVRGASLIVERRIELHETSVLPSPLRQTSASPLLSQDVNDSHSTIRPLSHSASCPPPSLPSYLHANHYGPPSAATSTATLGSTFSIETYSSSSDQRPLLHPIVTDLPAKTISFNVAGMDYSGPFTKDSNGAYSKMLTFQWPAAKSNSHWAMGETMETDLINVRFFVHIKVIISSSSGGAETMELEERELFLISTNDSQRKLALSKYNDSSTRSKSKSPRRGRDPLPSPPESPGEPVPPLPELPPSSFLLDRMPTLTRVSTSSNSSTSTIRRPHTSAGPRDKSNNRPHHSHPHSTHRDRDHDPENDRRRSAKEPLFSFRTRERPGTAMPMPTPPPLPPMLSKSNTRPSAKCELTSDPRTVRAWEEELERIELQSRRSSADMLGFKRKRAMSRPGTGHTSSGSSFNSQGSSP